MSIGILRPAIRRMEATSSSKPLCRLVVGPPFHIQTREEEAFYILEGELSFYGDDGEVVAGPGSYLNIPKGAKHRFRNNGDQTAKMLFFFTPSGIEGLFDDLAQMEVPAGDFSSVIQALNLLGEGYGVEYLQE